MAHERDCKWTPWLPVLVVSSYEHPLALCPTLVMVRQEAPF